MSLTLSVVVRDGCTNLIRNEKWESPLHRLLAWARQAPIDDLHIWVDKRSRDETFDVATKADAKVRHIVVDTIDAALEQAHSAIKTDWGLHLGVDEVMGDRFNQFAAEMMACEDVACWALPRYNLTREGHYIANEPRYPDYARRLFRRGRIHHPGEVHEGPLVDGKVAYGQAHVFHFDMLDQPREARMQKWDRYVKQGVIAASRDRGLPPWYYRQWAVFEDYEIVERPTDEGCLWWPGGLP